LILIEGNLRHKWAVKMSPNIIDPNHDRNPIRLKVENIFLPAVGQVGHPVTARASVDNSQCYLGSMSCQQGGRLGHIAVTEANFPGAEWAGAAAVGDGIASEEERFSALEYHEKEGSGDARKKRRTSGPTHEGLGDEGVLDDVNNPLAGENSIGEIVEVSITSDDRNGKAFGGIIIEADFRAIGCHCEGDV